MSASKNNQEEPKKVLKLLAKYYRQQGCNELAAEVFARVRRRDKANSADSERGDRSE